MLRILHCIATAVALLSLTTVSAADVPRYDASGGALEESETRIGRFTFQPMLPPGFRVEAMVVELGAPRIIHFSGQRMFIGSQSGDVYWLEPPYREANLLTTLDGYPHSVVVDGNRIYVARTNDIVVADYSGEGAIPAGDFEKLVDLPGGSGHSSRTLKKGPDGRLYVSLGIAGNCSDQYLDDSYPFTDQRGGLFVVHREGNSATLVPYASGLRNPIGFDWLPGTSIIYASNNGPDHLGYEQPPEQFVRITEDSFHGMPWYQYSGEDFFRDDCVRSEPPRDRTSLPAPVALFPARNAPMDVVFIDPEANHPFAGEAIVALHGSWATSDAENGRGSPQSRREPGLVRVEFMDGEAVAVHDLLRGLQLKDGQRWARPVGVAFGPDGHIYFTSDAGIPGLYRIAKISSG